MILKGYEKPDSNIHGFWYGIPLLKSFRESHLMPKNLILTSKHIYQPYVT